MDKQSFTMRIARGFLVVAALAVLVGASWAVDPVPRADFSSTTFYNYSNFAGAYIEAGNSTTRAARAVAFDGKYYFVVQGFDRLELWVSDNTSTRPLMRDIGGKNLTDRDKVFMCGVTGTALGNILFFSATPSTDVWADHKAADADPWVLLGTELFATNGIDGTSANTFLVKDIYPGDTYNHSQPQSLTAMGNQLYFSATNGTNGRELWTSNGTAGGTAMVQDINLGSGSSLDTTNNAPQMCVTTNGNGTQTLFFVADNGKSGPELWKSNGVAATPTTLVTGAPANWTAGGNVTKGSEIRNEPGHENETCVKLTAGGAVLQAYAIGYIDLVPEFNPGGTYVDLSSVSSLTVWVKGKSDAGLERLSVALNDTVLSGSWLSARWVSPQFGLPGTFDVWGAHTVWLDHTRGDLSRVRYLAIIPAGSNAWKSPEYLTVDEITMTRGEDSTAMVRNLGAIATGTAAVKSLTAINDKAYFYYGNTVYRDGIARLSEGGEPMVSDGTPAGTYMLDKVTSAYPPTGYAPSGNPAGSGPGSFMLGPGGSEVYFAASTEGYGAELYRIGAGVRPASANDAYWVPRSPCDILRSHAETNTFTQHIIEATGGPAGGPALKMPWTPGSTAQVRNAAIGLLNRAIPALDVSAGGKFRCQMLVTMNSGTSNLNPSTMLRMGFSSLETGWASNGLGVYGVGSVTSCPAGVWTQVDFTVPAQANMSRAMAFVLQPGSVTWTPGATFGSLRIAELKWQPTGSSDWIDMGLTNQLYSWAAAAVTPGDVTVAVSTTAGEYSGANGGLKLTVGATTATSATTAVLAEETYPTWALSWSGSKRLSCWVKCSIAVPNGAFALRLFNGATSVDVPLTTTLLSTADTMTAAGWAFYEADISAALAALGNAVTKVQVLQAGARAGTYILYVDEIRTKNFDGARVCDMAVKGASGSSPALATAAGGLVAFRSESSSNFVATNGVNVGQEVYGYAPESNTNLLLKDARSSSTATSWTDLLTSVGGAVCYIAANSSSNGYREVYRSYKIASGSYAARLTKDLNTTNTAAGPVSLTAVGSTLFYGHSTNQVNPNRLYAFDAAADTLTVSAVTQVDSDAGSRYAKPGTGPFTFALTVAGTGFYHSAAQTRTATLYRTGTNTAVATTTTVAGTDNTSATITFTGITNANLPVGSYDLVVTVTRTGDPAEYTRATGVFAVTSATASPSITSLTPDTGFTTETGNLTIEGEDFGETAGMVTLINRDVPATTVDLAVSASDPDNWTGTSITGTVDLAAMAGVWDIRVTTADGGVATRSSALTVTGATITSALLSLNPAAWPVTQGTTITLSAWGQGAGTPLLHSCDSGWTSPLGATVAKVGRDLTVTQGGGAVRVQVVAVTTGGVLASVDLGSNPQTLTGATRVSFWVRAALPGVVTKASKLAAGSLKLELYDTGGALLQTLPVSVDVYDRVWARVTVETTAFNATVQSIKLVAGATPPSAGTYVWLDDIRWTSGADLTYKFKARTYSSATGTYSTVTLNDFAAAPTFAWTPTITGPYWITAEVKLSTGAAAGSPELYTRIDPTTLTAVSLAKTGAAAPYTLTATKVGTATNVEYKFVVNRRTSVNPAKYTSYVVRDYATGNTCAWDPATTGGSAVYQVFVYARIVGSTSSLQVYSPKLPVNF